MTRRRKRCGYTIRTVPTLVEAAIGETLRRQLARPIHVLDTTPWQRDRLIELGLTMVGEVLHASERSLQRIAYVGEVRSRRRRNAAIAAVYEYCQAALNLPPFLRQPGNTTVLHSRHLLFD